MHKKISILLEKQEKLVPLPKIIQRLRTIIENPKTGMSDIARVIQSDPVLTGRLIQLANSVFCRGSQFQFSQDGLTRALTRLGLKMAMDIAYSLELPKVFDESPGIDQEKFWRYSQALAVASSRLAKMWGADRDEQSSAYLGGLMSNIGALLFSQSISEEYDALLTKVRNLMDRKAIPYDKLRGLDLGPLEERIFGISHADFGARYISKWWNVDQEVINYVKVRSKKLTPTLKDAVEIGKLLLYVEGIEDGVLISPRELPKEYLLLRFKLSEEQYESLRQDMLESLRIVS